MVEQEKREANKAEKPEQEGKEAASPENGHPEPSPGDMRSLSQ
jgi:hypothetical protein